MNKGLKITLIALGVIGTGVGLYFLLRKPKNPNIPNTPNTPSSPNTPTTPVSEFPLKRGSKGDKVKQLQRYLNINYSSGLVVDGDFGPKTQAALNTATGLSQVSESWYQNNVLNVNIPTVTDRDNDGIPDSIDIDGGDGTNVSPGNTSNNQNNLLSNNLMDGYQLNPIVAVADNTGMGTGYGYFDGTWFNEQNEY
tara:strand:- start:248 stop:832 length:585 start_codon:yes stop_codon:yes gene_type:complete